MSTNVSLQTSPLAGKRVLLTRAADQARETARSLADRGAIVLECPTISLAAPESWAKIDDAIKRLAEFDWLILTSVNGVRFFFGRMQELGLQPDELVIKNICAVGPKTAQALAEKGITACLTPRQLFTAEGVVEVFRNIELYGKRVLFPKADGARDLIPSQLCLAGACVEDPVVYRNIMPDRLPPEARQALEQQQIDIAIFSSPSTVQNLALLLGGADQLATALSNSLVASIGPITTKACQDMGIKVDLEPEKATFDDLLHELEDACFQQVS